MKLAVAGLGYMGTTHAKALRAVPGAELAAVFSRDEAKLAGFPAAARYREIDGLPDDPTIDAIDICLPTDLHDTVAVAALGAGKHVLVEKPMALDGFGADRMIHASRRRLAAAS